MPDSRASFDTPHSWEDAFAALPLESPPAGTWTSLARRLPRRPPDSRRTGRPYWYAMAAAVALAAVIPVFRWTANETPSVSSPVATAPTPSTPQPTPQPTSQSASAAASPVSPDVAPSASAAVADQPQSMAQLSALENSASSTPATATAAAVPRVDKPARSRKAPPSPPQESAVRAVAIAAEQRGRLENLYAESARLEAVLAQLHEPRVASATSAALSAELQDRIADIDGALSQPDVPSTSQLDLWQQRVDALRQLTGVETTQRWMAAQGTATEGSLAQVY